MRTLAVASQKGGVGKTTAAVNLAALWANQSRVLLVDMDPQGNATAGVGVSEGQLVNTVAEVLLSECTANEALMQTNFGRLTLLPADVGLARLEAADLPINALANALRTLVGTFDMVVIDCPPSLGRLTLNALAAAERVLIPVRAGRFSLKGLQQLLDTAESLRLRRVNTRLRALGVFLNEAQPHTNLYKTVEDTLTRSYGTLLLETFVPVNVRLGEAQIMGEPINVYDPRASGADAFSQLAKEVLDRWPEIARPA